MINFIETLFGVAIVAVVGALVLQWRGRRPGARRLGIVAGLAFALAVPLEVYVRYVR